MQDAYVSAETLYCSEQFEEALSVLAASSGAEAFNLAAACCLALGRFSDAEAHCLRAIDTNPHFADAYNNLGIILRKSDRLTDADAAFRQALDIAPDNASAHTNLGRLLEARDKPEAALESHRRAVECNPDDAATQMNFGACCMRLDRFDDAERAFQRVVMLKPHYADGHFNLGVALKKLARFEEAEAAYREALHLRPDHMDARLNLAHVLLGLGQFSEGWAMFEARYEPGGWFEPPRTGLPMWQGESLEGKSLIVWSEQGLGDSLQFCRYLPMLKALGLRKLSFACPPPLGTLFATIEGVDACLDWNDESIALTYDYQCMLMSLPHRFGTTLASVPASLPYLRISDEQALAWRNKLPAGDFKVGLVWAGDPRHHSAHLNAVDKLRSLSAQAYLPILRVPGATFVSLQKGVSTQPQIDTLPAELRPFDPMAEVEDFADTAAIIDQLDLVITVDTSVAHLAGALNKPVWILSRSDGCWRWLYRGDASSPWYPNARLFRQTRGGDWNEVIEAVASALDQLLRRPSRLAQ